MARKKTTIASPMMRKKIFDRYNGRCAYCGCELDLHDFHIDHFIPLSKGGKNGDNRFPSCPTCNMCKGELDSEEFKQKILNIFKDCTGKIALIQKFYDVKLKSDKFYFEVK